MADAQGRVYFSGRGRPSALLRPREEQARQDHGAAARDDRRAKKADTLRAAASRPAKDGTSTA